MVAAGQDPVLVDGLVGADEPVAALGLPRREVAHFGQAVHFAHALEDAVELGLFGEPFGVELGHDRERLVEEVEPAVVVELRRARGHVIGQLALRFDVARKLDARVLEVLDIDREPRHRAGRQRDVDQAQHAPLLADRRRLGARIGLAELERALGPGARGVAARGVDQFGAARDDLRGVARLDRRDERRIDEAEAEVGPAIPHRERRGLDQLGQGIERAFGLAEAARQRGAFGFGLADVEEPQQHRAMGLGRRRGGALHFDDAVRGDEPDHPPKGLGAERSELEVGGERGEVLLHQPDAAAGELIEPRRAVVEAKVALERGVDVDAVVGADDQRARGSGFEQGAQASRGADHGLGAGDAARGKDREAGGNRDPQHRDDDDRRLQCPFVYHSNPRDQATVIECAAPIANRREDSASLAKLSPENGTKEKAAPAGSGLSSVRSNKVSSWSE